MEYKDPVRYIPIDVGPPLLKGSPIISFGARPFRIRALIGRPPIMSFNLGGLKIWEGYSTIPSKTNHRDLRTVGAQGAVLRIPIFFRRALMLGGAPYLLKRAHHHILVVPCLGFPVKSLYSPQTEKKNPAA